MFECDEQKNQRIVIEHNKIVCKKKTFSQISGFKKFTSDKCKLKLKKDIVFFSQIDK